MNRLTNLDLAILRTSPGKSDTFIYTVPKVNKVKAYCKLGKLEDIMEHFKIESIEQLENILEAWETYKTYELVPITATVEVSDFDRDNLTHHRKEVDRFIKKELKFKLMENITPKYNSYRNIERCSTIYQAKIYVSSGDEI